MNDPGAEHEAVMPCSARATVDELRANRQARRLLEVRDLELAAHFADQNGWVDSSQHDHVVPGTERLVRLGGEGTPEVAEFCTLELAAALGMRDVEARSLVADALDLRHRLPRLWRLVLGGELDAWKARRLASQTRLLDAHAAGLVDLQLARACVGTSLARLERLAEGLVLQHLPAEEAESRREAALEARGVWISQGDHGVCDVGAVLDAPAGLQLEATVTQLSRVLAQGGATGGEDARRAQALGLLATPARALALQQASLLDELPGISPAASPALAAPSDAATPGEEGTSFGCQLVGMPGHVCGTIDERLDPEALLPHAQVVLHLTDATLADASGPVRVEQLKPLLAEWLADLFGTHRISVRPVIDANRQVPSDAYECPPTMREAIVQRSPHEAFPWSTRRSTGLDLDHTDPYREPSRSPRSPGRGRGGPPGQTRPDNLAPLTRKAHRAKTHSGWQLHQPMPGVMLWQSSLGFRYLVTPSRTIDLGRPDAPVDLCGLPRDDLPRDDLRPAA